MAPFSKREALAHALHVRTERFQHKGPAQTFRPRLRQRDGTTRLPAALAARWRRGAAGERRRTLAGAAPSGKPNRASQNRAPGLRPGATHQAGPGSPSWPRRNGMFSARRAGGGAVRVVPRDLASPRAAQSAVPKKAKKGLCAQPGSAFPPGRPCCAAGHLHGERGRRLQGRHVWEDSEDRGLKPP